jgi:LL-H family phage holin
MEDMIMELAFNLLLVLITAGVGLVVELIRRKLGTEKMRKIQTELEMKQELALVAVKAVEQLWVGKIKGPEKVSKAAVIIAKQAARIGLTIPPDEIEALIEWAVRTMKDEFGEEWAGAINGETTAGTIDANKITTGPVTIYTKE